jgi:hypothetical protein
VAALRVVHDRGERACVSVRQACEPLENGRHWFEDAVTGAEINNFRWHDLRDIFASRLPMKGAPLEDIADYWGTRV